MSASKILTGAILGSHFAPDVIVEEQQPSGTNAGTATSGSWLKRALNTLVRNNGSIASLASNQITLPAGTYYFSWNAPAFAVDRHRTRIQNITDATTVALGTSDCASSGTASGFNRSAGSCVVSIASSKTFELNHQVQTPQAANGLGIPGSFGTETYARLEITRLA